MNAPLALLTLSLLVVFRKYVESRLLELTLRYFKSESQARIATQVTLYLVYALLILVFLSSLGLPVQNLLVAGGFITLAVSFAAQTVISNAISGLFLMIEQPIKRGDFVEVKDLGINGTVESISIFSTSLLTPSGEVARIPNSTFFNNIIINKSRTLARRLEVEVGVDYSDAIKALEILRRFVKEYEYFLAEPEPEVFIKDFGDFAVIIRINGWVRKDKWYEAYKRVREDVLRLLTENGINIPYPTYDVRVHSP